MKHLLIICILILSACSHKNHKFKEVNDEVKNKIYAEKNNKVFIYRDCNRVGKHLDVLIIFNDETLAKIERCQLEMFNFPLQERNSIEVRFTRFKEISSFFTQDIFEVLENSNVGYASIDYSKNKIIFSNWSSYEAYEDTVQDNHYFYVSIEKNGYALRIEEMSKEKFISYLNYR